MLVVSKTCYNHVNEMPDWLWVDQSFSVAAAVAVSRCGRCTP